MQRLEVSGAVRLIYVLLGVKRLRNPKIHYLVHKSLSARSMLIQYNYDKYNSSKQNITYCYCIVIIFYASSYRNMNYTTDHLYVLQSVLEILQSLILRRN